MPFGIQLHIFDEVQAKIVDENKLLTNKNGPTFYRLGLTIVPSSDLDWESRNFLSDRS